MLHMAMCCRRSRGAANGLGIFFSFKSVRIKALETLFWSHKPSLAWYAKTKFSVLRWSELSSELIK